MLRQERPSARNRRQVRRGPPPARPPRWRRRPGCGRERGPRAPCYRRPTGGLFGAVGLNVRIQAREGPKNLDVPIISRTELEAVFLRNLEGDLEDVDRVEAEAFSIQR